MPSQIKYNLVNATGVPKLTNWLNRYRLLVLTYHGVYCDPHLKNRLPPTFIHDKKMISQLKEIKKKYSVISPNSLLKHLSEKRPLPAHSALITFDDGYESFARVAAPILNSMGIKAIVFTPTYYVEKRETFWFDLLWFFTKILIPDSGDTLWEIFDIPKDSHAILLQDPEKFINVFKMMGVLERDRVMKKIRTYCQSTQGDHQQVLNHFYCLSEKTVKKLAAQGTSFGGHTHSHTILSSMSDTDAKKEIVVNKEKLEVMTGNPCDFFAYPNGGKRDFTDKHKKILSGAGFLASFSLTHARSNIFNDSMDISRINVVPEDSLKSLLLRCTGITPFIDALQINQRSV